MSHRRWNCRWIWAPTELKPVASVLRIEAFGSSEERVFLRRSFTLANPPQEAEARIVADSRYILYVNGREASRGPVRGEPSKLHYDAVDLAPYLQSGENTIAIHAVYYADPTPWWIPALPSPGLGRRGAVSFEVSLADGEWLGSDAAWRSLKADAWRPMPRGGLSPLPNEDVDAAKIPFGWQTQAFDDSDWPQAEELAPLRMGGDASVKSPPSNPYGALQRRPIPQLEGEIRVPSVVSTFTVEDMPAESTPPESAWRDERRPVTEKLAVVSTLPLQLDGDGTRLALLDFGEIVSGTVAFEFEAPAGVEIDIGVRETEEVPEEGGLDPGSAAALRYRTRGHDDAFESFDSMGLRYALVVIRGAKGPVTIRRFEVHERLYPEGPGPEFECSDELLNRIYQVGKRTIAINSHDAYLDCPSREQRGWTGDAVVHQMVHLASNSDWGLARWHAQMSNAPRPDGMLPMAAGSDLSSSSTTIPEWPLHWIRSIWNLWRYTGDQELVGGLMAGAENVLRWFLPYRGPLGLVCNIDHWVLIDWAALHVSDTSSCLNAQWARALLEFAEMSEWLGDAGRAEWARGLHSEIRESFELFWDESRGAYVDHAIDGVPQRPMSQHAGATAVWAGLVPSDRIDRVLDGITDRARLVRATWMEISGREYLINGPGQPTWDVETEVVAAQPFYRYVVHDALASAGRADEIVSQCRDWGEFLDRGESTWPELWKGGTHCHGWGSTPTRDLVVRTLGIEPAEPGFAVARIAPRLGDLEWVRGAAPTPHGLIRVRADRTQIEITSPVPVDLDLPGRAPERLPEGDHIVSMQLDKA